MNNKIRSIWILGNRWFRRSCGNTYHTTDIYINGEHIHKTKKAYGYESCYQQSAVEWLQANGHLPKTERHLILWRYCDENNIELLSNANDVKRERDL